MLLGTRIGSIPPRTPRACIAILALLVIPGCEKRITEGAHTAAELTAARTGELSASVTLEDGDGFTRGLGETAGALIEVIRPDDWNGDLVLLMHGNVPPGAPIALRHPFHWHVQPTIDALLARGYGVALSSYRVNGFAVAEGAIDTRIAEATFGSLFGAPGETYLVGWSMGGVVGHRLVAEGAGRYAGLLSLCSDQVGPHRVHEYWLDARLLFDYYFPGVLPWNLETDQADLFLDLLPAVQAAFIADPAAYVEKVVKLSSIEQLQLPLGDGSPIALILTVLGSLFGFGGGNADLIQKLGGLPVGNADRTYTSDVLSSAELADINANVARYVADEGARQRMSRLAPDGRLHGTPVLALHTDGDAIVPVFVPAELTPVVEAAGDGDLFVLRVEPGFGHCGVTPTGAPDAFFDLQMRAFDDLVAWVEDGVRPVP